MSDLVSVIIPIYNVDAYLDDCLESVTKQTYENLEIICVDDGSIDNSGKKADQWSGQDSRIRVIHKGNGGLSDARNVGIQTASGEFIAPVDSDDFLDTRYIEKLLLACEDTGADVSICDIMRVSEDSHLSVHGSNSGINDIDQSDVPLSGIGRTVFADKDASETTERCKKESEESGKAVIFTPRECLVNMYHPISSGMSFTAWGKLYRRSLFTHHNIWYPKGRINEDQFTTYKLIYAAQGIAYVPEKLYAYRQRQGSIMKREQAGYDLRRLDQKDATREQCDFFLEKGEKELSALAVNNHIRTMFSLLACMRESRTGEAGSADSALSDSEQELITEIRKDVGHYLPLVKFPAVKKAAFRAAAAMPGRGIVNRMRMF